MTSNLQFLENAALITSCTSTFFLACDAFSFEEECWIKVIEQALFGSSFIVLLVKMKATKSAHGISLKFLCLQLASRLVLFTSASYMEGYIRSNIFRSIILLCVLTVMLVKYYDTIDFEDDGLPLYLSLFLTPFSMMIAMKRKGIIFAWLLSLQANLCSLLYAIYMLHRQSKRNDCKVDTIFSHFVAITVIYRIVTLIEVMLWFENRNDLIYVWFCVLECILAFDFLYYYFDAVRKNKQMTLPSLNMLPRTDNDVMTTMSEFLFKQSMRSPKDSGYALGIYWADLLF